MDEYIRQEMIYPEEAIKQQIQGIVSLKFDIDEFGTVSNIQVVHSVGAGCDEEAVRLVSLLRFEKTKKQGLKVIFHHSLNIHFRLPIPAPVIGPETVRIQYEIKKDPEPSKPDESGSLGYTIRF